MYKQVQYLTTDVTLAILQELLETTVGKWLQEEITSLRLV